jgi:hypothetical protein
MALIKHCWYLINVERHKEKVAVSVLTPLTPLKTIRTTLVSVIFRQFSRSFGHFDIAG